MICKYLSMAHDLSIHEAIASTNATKPLQWRNNGRDTVSNHQPHDCLLNRLCRRRSKKTSKPRVTGLCAGNSPGPVNSPHKWPVTPGLDAYFFPRLAVGQPSNNMDLSEIEIYLGMMIIQFFFLFFVYNENIANRGELWSFVCLLFTSGLHAVT